MTKKQYNLRLPKDLITWVDVNAEALGARDRTDLVQQLLEAAKEGRLVIHPRSGPSAFPADEVSAGSSAEFPALIAE